MLEKHPANLLISKMSTWDNFKSYTSNTTAIWLLFIILFYMHGLYEWIWNLHNSIYYTNFLYNSSAACSASYDSFLILT